MTDIQWLPGTVILLCAAIGITAFDGARHGRDRVRERSNADLRLGDGTTGCVAAALAG